MDTRSETITPRTNVVRTMRKRDRLLNMLMVKKEQERIAEYRFHRYKDEFPKAKEKYLEWCKNNNVDSLTD